ncbi:multidrug effflux MFS transporter [Microbacterium sp. RU33B]|uniref:multidrug effflux MFS transporter n=1 Tax=Microbacterium sp. RU33B TaxID=1907390 RepID=UPI0009629D66|nr:multidrug effflux MFS transporter [Microbacterium sp. RU33B]SIT83438.1 MFS transporter, DHA1 family, bicyclomycin/chloramphenicol resistance protein [Microbacterium sp. RU33B]
MTAAPTATTVRAPVLPALLLLLTVFGPISMDLYLPALPALSVELGAVTSVAQLTVTACLIGLAAGQLIAGPLSDRYGRRGILLSGIVAYIATSVLCAISPTVELLILARLVQGLAGGVGIVIAQAAGRDIYSGRSLILFYGRLTVIGGFAAILGPLLGGVLVAITDWRGLFVFLAVIGAGILIVTLIVFRETLPADRRTSGGLVETLRDFRALATDRQFLGAVFTQGFLYAALFAYLAGSTFVLQDVYGLTPLQYALAFGLNSAGFMVFGYLAGRASERWSIAGTLALGVAVAGAGAAGLLLAGVSAMPLWLVIVALFLLASGVAISSPPATTLALADYPQMAGTASSLLGMVRFGFGAVAAPLVGVAGATSILPLGAVTVSAVVLAGASLVLAGAPTPARLPLTDN